MAVTYAVATDTITIAGFSEVTPCTYQDFWDADKAGTRSLHDRTGIGATDGAPVAIDDALYPADYVVLGGASNDLYITVTNWTNMTTATIRVTGTDRDGAAQTDDVVVNGNGNFSTAKWFKTITHTQVTVFTKSNAGSFDYDLIQGQWGRNWKVGDTYFCEANVLLTYDAWFADDSVACQMGTVANPVTFKSYALANDTHHFKLTYSWLCLHQANVFSPFQAKFILDGCVYRKYGARYYPQFSVLETRITNSYLATVDLYIQSGLCYIRESVADFVSHAHGNFYFYTATEPDIDDLTVKDAVYSLYLAASLEVTVENSVFSDWIYITANDGILRLVNCTFDDTKLALLQFRTGLYILDTKEFDLRVDEDGTGIAGVTVVIEDANGDAIPGSPFTTDGSGDIATQEITHRRFDVNPVAFPYTPIETVYSPFTVTISRAGYVTRPIVYTMDRAREEIERLLPKGMKKTIEGELLMEINSVGDLLRIA